VARALPQRGRRQRHRQRVEWIDAAARVGREARRNRRVRPGEIIEAAKMRIAMREQRHRVQIVRSRRDGRGQRSARLHVIAAVDQHRAEVCERGSVLRVFA